MKNLFALLIIISFFSCKKDNANKLSNDICIACNQNPKYIIGKDTLWIPTVFTPNGDGINDVFTIMGIEKDTNNSIVFYNRNMNQIAQYSPYSNEWTGASNNNSVQIKPSNGLYYYKLTINSNIIKGSVIILIKKDDYYNIKISGNTCGENCSLLHYPDPMFFDN